MVPVFACPLCGQFQVDNSVNIYSLPMKSVLNRYIDGETFLLKYRRCHHCKSNRLGFRSATKRQRDKNARDFFGGQKWGDRYDRATGHTCSFEDIYGSKSPVTKADCQKSAFRKFKRLSRAGFVKKKTKEFFTMIVGMKKMNELNKLN